MKEIYTILLLALIGGSLSAKTEYIITYRAEDGRYHLKAPSDWKEKKTEDPLIIEIHKGDKLNISVAKLPLEPLKTLTAEAILNSVFESMKKRMRIRIIHPIKSSKQKGIETSVVIFDTVDTSEEKPKVTRLVLSITKNNYDVLQVLVGCDGDLIPDGLFEAMAVANTLNLNGN
ncbi:MAG: hypothetical protein AAGH40_02870 [Verrucomicrobiota bacterium]